MILQGATRSPDGRIGTGAAARVVVQGAASWWKGPPAELFSVPLETQLLRAPDAQDLPPFLRPEASDLLFVDAVVTDTPGVILAQGRCLALAPREGATAREAAQVTQLGEAAGASVRLLGRLSGGRHVVPLAVAGSGGAPWRLGDDDARLAPWPALLEAHRVAPPAARLRPRLRCDPGRPWSAWWARCCCRTSAP